MKIRPGIIVCGLVLAAFTVPFSIYTANAVKGKEAAAQRFKEIHTEELKQLIDSKKPALIFDARKSITVGVLPGAKHLSYDADGNTIAKAIGAHPKDYMIVVYCARVECPLSKYLAENLISEGYTNVYKYPEGIEAWMKSYPIDRIKS